MISRQNPCSHFHGRPVWPWTRTRASERYASFRQSVIARHWAAVKVTFEPHIDELCKKLSKRLGLLKQISPYLKQRQRETSYNGVVRPTLMYGSMIWDGCSGVSLQRILKLQKRAARIILKADRSTPSISLFNSLNWLPFTKQSLIKRCTLAFKRVHSEYYTPGYIDRILVRNSEIHNRETFFKPEFDVPAV